MFTGTQSILKEENGLVEYYTGKGQVSFRSKEVGDREALERFHWFSRRNIAALLLSNFYTDAFSCEIGGSTYHKLCTAGSNLDLILYGAWSPQQIRELTVTSKLNSGERLMNYISPAPYMLTLHFDNYVQCIQNPQRHIDWQAWNKELYTHKKLSSER